MIAGSSTTMKIVHIVLYAVGYTIVLRNVASMLIILEENQTNTRGTFLYANNARTFENKAI